MTQHQVVLTASACYPVKQEGEVATSIKQAALRVIQRLPDDASLEEVMYELYFRQRVELGLRELDSGKTVSHSEVKRSLAQWLRSVGR
jgi:predicted transcriptional regulator